MSRLTGRVAAVGVAAFALGMGFGVGGTAAAPTTPGSAPAYAPSWLALRTGTTNTVTLASASGVSATQNLRAGKACAYSSSGASLLGIGSDPAAPGVGFASGALGVRESTTASGRSCSAVDAVNVESLTLTLGTGVGGLLAGSASLDVDLKQSAQILAVAKRGGTAVGWYELRSGTTIDAPRRLPDGAVPDGKDTTLFKCNNPADSGPDSGINNNCRWEISAPSWTGLAEDGVAFDRLELTAVNGSFSLEGGADGYVDDPVAPLPGYFGASGPSVFELVDGTLDCTSNNTATLRSSSSVPKSTWKRLGNLTDGGTNTGSCATYPYSATTGTNSSGQPFAQFNKPLNYEPNAQALWETTFTYSGNVADPIPNTKPGLPKVYMDLDGDNAGEFELTWCDASWTVSGVFVGPSSPSVVPRNPYACLVSAVRGTGSAKKYVTYTAYVFGDATMRR